MTSRFTRHALVAAAFSVSLILPASATSAQTAVASNQGVAGTWVMQVMSHQVGLVLSQDGSKVKGTMNMMGKDVKVEGEFVDGKLTLKSNARVMGRQADGAATSSAPGDGGAPHAGSAGAGTALSLTATLKDDGSLEGEIPGPDGKPETWTAERLRERKPKSPAPEAGQPDGLCTTR